MAMVTSVTGVATVIGNFGLSVAALREKGLTQLQKSALFWINTAIGLAVGIIVAALAVPIATFYHEATLVPVTLVLALTFLMNGAVVQHKVELNRSGAFATLGTLEFVAQVAGLLAAVIAAVLGAGIWALVIQQVVMSALALVLALTLAKWRPSAVVFRGNVRHLVLFGWNTLVVQVMNYLTANLDSFLIGRFSGASILGIYNRAYQLIAIPSIQIAQPLTRVILPRLSSHETPEAIHPVLVRLQRLLSYSVLGPVSLLVATSSSLVPFLLGSDWSGVSTYLVLLAGSALFRTIGYATNWGFLALGRSGLLLAAESAARLVMVVLIVIAAFHSAIYVAVAVSVGQGLLWASQAWIFGPRIGLPTLRLNGASVRPVLIFGIAGAAGWAITERTVGLPPILGLAFGILAWLVPLAASLIFPAVRHDAREVVTLLVRRRRRQQAA